MPAPEQRVVNCKVAASMGLVDKIFDANLRGFEVFRSLDEMKAPIATCLEDRQRRLHPAYSRGLPGTVEGYYD
jgi:hypothetical protein